MSDAPLEFPVFAVTLNNDVETPFPSRAQYAEKPPGIERGGMRSRYDRISSRAGRLRAELPVARSASQENPR